MIRAGIWMWMTRKGVTAQKAAITSYPQVHIPGLARSFMPITYISDNTKQSMPSLWPQKPKLSNIYEKITTEIS